LQLRLFQTLTEISSENSSTVILPVPIDLFKPYLGAANGSGDAQASQPLTGSPAEEEQSERPNGEPVREDRAMGQAP
jgi:hypothetical protein